MQRSISFFVEGDVTTEVTVQEMEDGTLRFDVRIVDETDLIGDLRAIFFDLEGVDVSDLNLQVDGDLVSDRSFDEGGVDTLGRDANIKGSVSSELGDFDVGVEFGSSGSSVDDIQETTFVLSSTSGDLSLDMLDLADFGLRYTSVGELEGERNSSLKLGDEGTGLSRDDTISAVENSSISSIGIASGLLANDTTENAVGTSFGSFVSQVEGLVATDDGFEGQVTAEDGIDLGSLFIGQDGSFEFVARADTLALGEMREVSLQYETTSIDGGRASASISLQVSGTNDKASISGLNNGEVFENQVFQTSGLLVVSDVDNGEARFSPQSQVVGEFGVFSIDTTGNWSYVLDNANSEVRQLLDGDQLFDIFLVSSIDGSASERITIEINGTNVALDIGTSEDEFVFVTGDTVEISGGGGIDQFVFSSVAQADGRVITDVSVGETIVFQDSSFGAESVMLTQGSLIVEIDENLDGQNDATLTLEGDFSNRTASIGSDAEGNTVLNIVELPGPFVVQEGQQITLDVIPVSSGSRITSASTASGAPIVFTGEPGSGIDFTATGGAFFLETLPGLFEYENLREGTSVAEVVVFEVTAEDGTVTPAATVEKQLLDLTVIDSQQTSALDLDGVTITASDDLSVLRFNGIGVVGGLADSSISPGETVTLTFDGLATNIFGRSTLGSNTDPGLPQQILIEGFDANGNSLGVREAAEGENLGDISGLFDFQPLSRVDIIPVADSFRLSFLQFDLINGDGFAVVTVEGVTTPNFDPIELSLDLFETDDETFFQFQDVGSQLPGGTFVNVENLQLVSGDDSGVFDFGGELLIDPSAYADLNAGEQEVITYEFVFDDGISEPLPAQAIITIIGEDDPLPGPFVVQEGQQITLDVIPVSSGSRITSASTASGAPIVFTGEPGSGIDFTATGGAFFLETLPGLFEYENLREGTSVAEVVVFEVTAEDGTVTPAATVEKQLLDLTVIDSQQTSALDLDGVTITASDDLSVLRFNGIGVVGGLADSSISPGETVTLTFDGLATNIFGRSTLGSNTDPGLPQQILIEGFDANGNSLGVREAAEGENLGDISGLFDFQPLSRVDIIPVADSFRLSFLQFDLINGDGFAVVTVEGVTTPNFDPIELSLDLFETDDETFFQFQDVGSQLPGGTFVNVENLQLVSGDDSGVFDFGGELLIDPSAYADLNAGEQEVITYEFVFDDGISEPLPAQAIITIIGEDDPLPGPFVVQEGQQITLDVIPVSSGSRITSASTASGAPIVFTGEPGSGIDFTATGGAFFLETLPGLFEYENLREGTSVAEVVVFEVTAEDGTVTPAATVEKQLLDLTVIDSQQTSALDLDGVTITASDDLSVLRFNGIGVVGGLADSSISPGETVTLTFDGLATNIFGRSTLGSNTDPGLPQQILIEGFDANGNSLGVREAAEGENLGDISGLFDFQPLSRVDIIPVADSFRLSFLQFDLINGDGFAVVTVEGVTTPNFDPIELSLDLFETDDETFFQFQDVGSQLPGGTFVNVENLQLVSGDDSGVFDFGGELLIDPSAYADLNAGEQEVITYEFVFDDGISEPLPAQAIITIIGEDDGSFI